MPRLLSRAARRAVRSSSLLCVDAMQVSTEPPYTVFDQNFVNDRASAVYADQRFTAFGFAIKPIETTSTYGVDKTEIEVDDVSGYWAALTAVRSVTGMRVRLLKTYPGVTTRPEEFIVLFDGFLGGPRFDGALMRVELRSILAYRDTPLPLRLYGANCPWQLGHGRCTVDMTAAENRRSFSAGSGSSRSTLVGGPVLNQPPGYWAEGYVRVLAGPNLGVVRPISSSRPGAVVVRFPFDRPLDGAVVEISRGCRKIKDDCEDRFDNLDDYGGCAEVPLTPAIDQVVSKVTSGGGK